MTTYDSTPVTGYIDGLIISDDAPISCTETFTDDRHPNTNHYFEIDGQFYNVHPRRHDLGGYPVRWISSYTPVGWPDDGDDFDKDCKSLVADVPYLKADNVVDIETDERKFACIWGMGYDEAAEIKKREFFTKAVGYDDDMIAAIDTLEINETYRIDDLAFHTVTRLA